MVIGCAISASTAEAEGMVIAYGILIFIFGQLLLFLRAIIKHKHLWTCFFCGFLLQFMEKPCVLGLWPVMNHLI